MKITIDNLLDKCVDIERFVIEDDNDFYKEYDYNDYASGAIPEELLNLAIDNISVDRNELIINLGERYDPDYLASFNDSRKKKKDSYDIDYDGIFHCDFIEYLNNDRNGNPRLIAYGTLTKNDGTKQKLRAKAFGNEASYVLEDGRDFKVKLGRSRNGDTEIAYADYIR